MTTPKPALPEPMPACSHCGFPLPKHGGGLRYYGTHTARQEHECLPKPDPQLCAFYSVDTFPALVAAMERHIEKLQSKLPPNDMPALTKTRFA